jgi:hypothetical protein
MQGVEPAPRSTGIHLGDPDGDVEHGQEVVKIVAIRGRYGHVATPSRPAAAKAIDPSMTSDVKA